MFLEALESVWPVFGPEDSAGAAGGSERLHDLLVANAPQVGAAPVAEALPPRPIADSEASGPSDVGASEPREGGGDGEGDPDQDR